MNVIDIAYYYTPIRSVGKPPHKYVWQPFPLQISSSVARTALSIPSAASEIRWASM